LFALPRSLQALATLPVGWRIVLGLWCVFLVGMTARSFLEPGRHSVYPIFAKAGASWIDGRLLYEPFQAKGEPDQFRYSPIVAACFAPLSQLPHGLGAVLWRFLNLAVFLGGAWCYVRDVLPERGAVTADNGSLIAFLLLPWGVSSLNNGQSNPLVIGALLFAVVASSHERWNLAAAWLAVAALFKIYPLAIALLLLLLYPKQLAGRLLVFMGVGLLLPFALQDYHYVADQYQEWANVLRADSRQAFELNRSYRDFHLLLRCVQVTLPQTIYLALQLAVAGAIALIVGLGKRRGWEKDELLHTLLNLGCCWMILFGPATENATYTLLAPCYAFAVWEARQPGRSAWTRAVFLSIFTLLVVNVVVTALPDGRLYVFWTNALCALLLFVERLLSLKRLPERNPVEPAPRDPPPPLCLPRSAPANESSTAVP
jgi:hypothetical protein